MRTRDYSLQGHYEFKDTEHNIEGLLTISFNNVSGTIVEKDYTPNGQEGKAPVDGMNFLEGTKHRQVCFFTTTPFANFPNPIFFDMSLFSRSTLQGTYHGYAAIIPDHFLEPMNVRGSTKLPLIARMAKYTGDITNASELMKVEFELLKQTK
jgi:hypothetical protein